MAQQKRWYRSWKLDMTKEEVQAIIARDADPAIYEVNPLNGPYTPADTQDLNGTTLDFAAEGQTYAFSVVSGSEIIFSENGGPGASCPGHVKTLEGEIYFLSLLAPGSDTARQISVVADMTTGCATVCDSVLGTAHSHRDVGRVFHFGRLSGSFPRRGELHGFTSDLVGKAAFWDYGDGGMEVKHIYNSNQWYTYSMKTDKGSWMASNPADYVHIRDNYYIVSFVEERQPGVQLLLLIDFDKMHDVGCAWGIDGDDRFLCACVGAYGTMVEPFTVF